jgi:2-dehydropantoate 2-reductase
VRYVIIGAGSIGCALAARLALHSPHPPLVVARGERADELRANGIRLRTPDDDVRVPVEVATDPVEAQLRKDDVLVLATKTHQADEALRTWADAPIVDETGARIGVAATQLPVFTALNGLESERIASRYFDRVYGVTVWLPAQSIEVGEVIVPISPKLGLLTIGAIPAAPVADHPVLQTLHDDFTAAGVAMFLEDDVMPWKWFKLLSNLSNALQALLGNEQSDAWSDLAQMLVEEAREVYAAAGIEVVSEQQEASRREDLFQSKPVPGVDRRMGGSSWQSLARGSGSIETDYLNGEIVRLAHSIGRSAPLNGLVQRLARGAARDRVAPGSWSVDALRAEFERCHLSH